MADAPGQPLSTLQLAEVAHLLCLRELGRGATHALNNALTAAFGLLGIAGGEEGLGSELERCARVTHALALRQARRAGQGTEIDLVGLVRDAGSLLRETLSRRFELEVRVPDDLLVVEADPLLVETVFYAALYRSAAACPDSGRLRIGVEGDKPGHAALVIEAHGVADDRADAVLGAGTGVSDDLGLAALRAAADACGAALGAARSGPAGLRIRAVFPLDT